jgi:dolichol-phosphate mannosyltransferase
MPMRIMATIPTYNEAENIGALIEALQREVPGIEVVVVDDDSPDGTWRIVEGLAAENPRVHLVHRTHERGRGTAGVAGFLYAVRAGADLVVEMDADFSHDPRFVPALLAGAENADVVIGSRLIAGGGEVGRSAVRRLITVLANFYIRVMLGVPVKDCTSGYRVFHRRVLEAIQLERMSSRGPAIVQEVLLACERKGFSFKEVPIILEERRAGASTFNWKIMLSGLVSVVRFRFGRKQN